MQCEIITWTFSIQGLIRVLLFEALLVLLGGKDLVELVLDLGALLQGPVGVLLVAEDDVVQDGPGDAQVLQHHRVHVRTLAARRLCRN